MQNGFVRHNRIATGVFVVLLATFSCKRDIAPTAVECAGDRLQPNQDDCWYIEEKYTGSVIESPTSNPNNPMEFAFIEDKELVKYNMETGEKITLVSGINLIQTPDWGKSGWIVFSAEWKIWKVRESGSGLEQITFGPREIWPEFDVTGTKVLYPRNMEYSGYDIERNPALRKGYKMMVIDLNGNPIDSFCREFEDDLCYPWEYSSWSANDRIAAEYGPSNDLEVYGLAIYDLDGQELNVPYETKKSKKDFPFISDIEWHPTENMVYFRDTRGLRWIDVGDEKIRFLRKNCEFEYYNDFTITSDSHIIAVKVESTSFKETCERSTEFYLVKMKIDGSKEEIIDIP